MIRLLLGLIVIGVLGCESQMKSSSSAPQGSVEDQDMPPPQSVPPAPPNVGSAPLPGSEPIVIPNTALGAVVKAAAQGTWVELPAGNIQPDVFPAANSTDCPNKSPHMTVVAWSGGAASDEALYIFGGGHFDYCGNELYKFRFEDLRWERTTEPSRYKADCVGVCETVDGTPTSVHTYDAVQWIPSLKALWAGPGAQWRGGTVGSKSYLFDSATRKWTQTASVPIRRPVLSEYDPVTGLILIGSTDGMLTALNPQTGAYYASQNPLNTGFGFSAASFDFHERKFAAMTSSTLVISDLSQVDWKNPATRLPAPVVQKTYAIQNGQKVEFYPPQGNGARWGIIYDSRRKLFLAWEGHRDLWMLDSKTWLWTKVENKTVGAQPESDLNHRGVFGRWQYLEKYDVYLGYPKSTGKPWIFKP